MFVKNLMKRDVHFQWLAVDTETEAKFEQINILPGWTVEIDDEIWAKIKEQEVRVNEVVEEEVEIEGVVVTNVMTGNKEKAKKVVRQLTGKSVKVNLIDHMVENMEIKLVDEKPKLPPRDAMELMLKRFNVDFKTNERDETLYKKVKKLQEEMLLMQSM